jgi:hypothetical protein
MILRRTLKNGHIPGTLESHMHALGCARAQERAEKAVSSHFC